MTPENLLKTFRNGSSIPLADVPETALELFLQGIVDLTGLGWRIASYFGMPDREGAALWCLLAGSNGRLGACRSWVEGSLPSITAVCPEAHLFEREIAEQCGIPLDGHTWSKPVRYLRSSVPGRDAWGRGGGDIILPAVGEFHRISGTEVHEVAVGPVHAGIIEPGHFRFQCHGETVFHLEIALGYQHRGVERALAGGPHRWTMSQMETLAGDTTIGHATAYAMVREGLAGCEVPERAHCIRGIALELERCANHCGDLGALAGDVGFLPTMSYCGRIRGDFLNMSALLCGSRFGRGLVRPGGVRFDCPPESAETLLRRLEAALTDFSGAAALLWDSATVMGRFDGTGVVTTGDALALGLTGPAARACGIARDVRHDHPHGPYTSERPRLCVENGGDVTARAKIRWRESETSIAHIRAAAAAMKEDETLTPCPHPRGGRLAVALVEGWRGEICHAAITDESGCFAVYKVTDPSFHNWSGLELALRSGQISDFPLCNKSFNLSYCGFDL